MNPDERQAFREKHSPLYQHQGRAGEVNYCKGCKNSSNTLAHKWPCDVIEVLDGFDELAAACVKIGVLE